MNSTGKWNKIKPYQANIENEGTFINVYSNPSQSSSIVVYNNGPNGHLFNVGGDLMMRRGMLPIIMLPDGDLRIAMHLVTFWLLTIWGSVHIEETVVGRLNQLRMKTSAT